MPVQTDVHKVIAEREGGNYMLRAEIVSYNGGRRLLNFARYRKVRIHDGTKDSGREAYWEFAGRPALDQDTIKWMIAEKILPTAIKEIANGTSQQQ